MLDQTTAKLQAEVAKGDEYQHVLDSYIKPFIEEKTQLLFEHFQNVPVESVDQLKDIKMQMTAIKSLESYFTGFIDTGKLARKQLEK